MNVSRATPCPNPLPINRYRIWCICNHRLLLTNRVDSFASPRRHSLTLQQLHLRLQVLLGLLPLLCRLHVQLRAGDAHGGVGPGALGGVCGLVGAALQRPGQRAAAAAGHGAPPRARSALQDQAAAALRSVRRRLPAPQRRPLPPPASNVHGGARPSASPHGAPGAASSANLTTRVSVES